MPVSYPLFDGVEITIDRDTIKYYVSCKYRENHDGNPIWQGESQKPLWGLSEKTLKSWAINISKNGGKDTPKAEAIFGQLQQIFAELKKDLEAQNARVQCLQHPVTETGRWLLKSTRSVTIYQNLDESLWHIILENEEGRLDTKLTGDQICESQTAFEKKYFNVCHLSIELDDETWSRLHRGWAAIAEVVDVNPDRHTDEDNIIDAIVDHVLKMRFGYDKALLLHDDYGWYDPETETLYVKSSVIERVISNCKTSVSRTALAATFRNSVYFGGTPTRISVNGTQRRVWRFSACAINPVIDRNPAPSVNSCGDAECGTVDIDEFEVAL